MGGLADSHRDQRTSKRDDCERLCGCWKLNLEPLEEHPVLLTAEPSLQPFYVFLDVSPKLTYISYTTVPPVHCMPVKRTNGGRFAKLQLYFLKETL